MSMHFVRACLAGAVLLGAVSFGQARDNKTKTSCPGYPVLAAAACHGSTFFGLGFDTCGDAILYVEIRENGDNPGPQDRQVMVPLGRWCPLLSPVVGLPVELLGDQMLGFAGGYLVRVNCEKEQVKAGASPPCKSQAVEKKEAAPETICPYLRQKNGERKTAAKVATSLESSVLQNLEHLEKAQHLLRRANALRKKGNLEKAAKLYRQVRKLCPGSRYDHWAGVCLKKMEKEERDLTREQKSKPTQPDHFIRHVEPGGFVSGLTSAPDLGIPIRTIGFRDSGNKTCAQQKVNNSDKKVETRVGKLLEACHNAFVAGQYEKAQDLGQKALKLNSTCVAAHPLVYKLNLLKQVEEKVAHSKTIFSDQYDIFFSSQQPVECETSDAEVSLCPSLPLIDPKIVDALEKVLAATADPLASKLVVFEDPQETPQDQEDAIAPWASGEPPADIPSLLVDPESKDLDVEAEQEVTPPPDWNGILREVIDAVGQGASIDVDTSREDCLRAECELEVGGVEVKLMWSEAGPSFAVLKLRPEVNPDLRAAQRAHNEEVLEWIRTLGDNGEGHEESAPDDVDWNSFGDDEEAEDTDTQS